MGTAYLRVGQREQELGQKRPEKKNSMENEKKEFRMKVSRISNLEICISVALRKSFSAWA